MEPKRFEVDGRTYVVYENATVADLKTMVGASDDTTAAYVNEDDDLVALRDRDRVETIPDGTNIAFQPDPFHTRDDPDEQVEYLEEEDTPPGWASHNGKIRYELSSAYRTVPPVVDIRFPHWDSDRNICVTGMRLLLVLPRADPHRSDDQTERGHD